MKRILNKKISTGALLAIILAAILSASALGAAANENIQAILSRDIKITYDGVIQDFRDAAGNRVYPLIYNGTTYLPVRAVCGMVGLDVEWDGAARTVILTSGAPGAAVRLIDVGTANYGVTATTDMSLFPEYGSGFKLTGFNRVYQVNSKMPLKGKYTTITFDVAMVSMVRKQLKDPLTLRLFNADTNVMLWEGRCEAGQILKGVSADITGVETLQWSFIGGDMQNEAVGYILDPYVR